MVGTTDVAPMMNKSHVGGGGGFLTFTKRLRYYAMGGRDQLFELRSDQRPCTCIDNCMPHTCKLHETYNVRGVVTTRSNLDSIINLIRI